MKTQISWRQFREIRPLLPIRPFGNASATGAISGAAASHNRRRRLALSFATARELRNIEVIPRCCRNEICEKCEREKNRERLLPNSYQTSSSSLSTTAAGDVSNRIRCRRRAGSPAMEEEVLAAWTGETGGDTLGGRDGGCSSGRLDGQSVTLVSNSCATVQMVQPGCGGAVSGSDVVPPSSMPSWNTGSPCSWKPRSTLPTSRRRLRRRSTSRRRPSLSPPLRLVVVLIAPRREAELRMRARAAPHIPERRK